MTKRGWLFLAGATLSACVAAAPVAAQTPVPATGEIGPRLNPTGRTVNLTVPLKDGPTYLGDIDVSISADDRVEFSSQRVLSLLGSILDARALEALQTAFAGKSLIGPQDFQGSGVTAVYDPRTLELVAQIPASLKAAKAVSVVALDRDQIGRFERPAGVSAYLNARGAVDYVHRGAEDGFADPLFLLDGAARFGPVALESEGIWRPGDDFNSEFQRLGSRLVYDDMRLVARWTLGDLQTVARGYQAAPELAGLSLFRSYGVLQPQRNVRPRGDQSFRLNRPSNVEVFVNGQMIRRIRLDPGAYNLRDFPFAQGANDVRLVVEDDLGVRENFNFSFFYDRGQLEPGLAEFGLFAGVLAPLDVEGPDYTEDWGITGFYRRGITERLTLGANIQGDERIQMGGLEAVWSSPIGTVGVDAALSQADGFGSGTAVTITLSRLYQGVGGGGRSFNLFFETRSRDFAPMGVAAPDNRFAWELGGAYVHTFSDRFYAGLDGRYSAGRGATPDAHSLRASVGARLTERTSLNLDGRYDRFDRRDEVSILLSLTTRLSRWSSLRADFDSRDERLRAGYQTARGQGVGAFALSADVERSRNAGGANAAASYLANRAELGASHFTSFDDDFSQVADSRTSLRLATAFAFADGAASIGRPVYDSFAIVKAHRAMKGAEVYIQPTEDSYAARTGLLGTAIEPQLSAYAERIVTIDAPAAPAGFDLGTGAFRLFPPYRGGYRLQVGSDYGVTAVGRLLDAEGNPISLQAGQAFEVAHPDRPGVALFTNREGRFGAQGLRPGRWRIEMPANAAFVIDVPQDAAGVWSAGELRAARTGS